MDEKKEFKKKQLNKEDYQTDEKVMGGIKFFLKSLAAAGALALTFLLKNDSNDSNDSNNE